MVLFLVLDENLKIRSSKSIEYGFRPLNLQCRIYQKKKNCEDLDLQLRLRLAIKNSEPHNTEPKLLANSNGDETLTQYNRHIDIYTNKVEEKVSTMCHVILPIPILRHVSSKETTSSFCFCFQLADLLLLLFLVFLTRRLA